MRALLSLSFLAAALAPQTDATLPPATAHVRLIADGLGTQAYQCTLTGSTFAWVYKEPLSDLFDPKTHQPVGTHTAGPTWTWNDSSAITGTVLKTVPSSDANALPWLLLETHSTGTPGALADITYVRRSDTQAGTSPTSACDAEHNGNTAKVPYKATYTFYASN